MKKKVLDALEQFSRAMLAPLSYLSVAGLLLVAGALLTSKPLQQLVPALAWPPLVQAGQVLYNCMMALLNNLSLLFCVGIAAVLAKREKQQAALIALMSGLLCLTACHTGLVQHDLLADPSGLQRPVRHRPDHRAGHPDHGPGRAGRHGAGAGRELDLQPHL